MTNYNTGNTIRACFRSLLPLLQNGLFEVVVVDNQSSDDSLPFLRELSQNGTIRSLVIKESTRGNGRQLAFSLASAPYILANIDSDVVYDGRAILEAIEQYHRRFEGRILSVYGMVIAPRRAISFLGGWKNMDRHEDSELAVHAFEKGLHAQDMSINVVKEHMKESRRGSKVNHWVESYCSFRDWFRIGMKRSDLKDGLLSHPTAFLGYMLSKFYLSYKHDKFSEWYRVWISKQVYGEIEEFTGPKKLGQKNP